MRRYLVAPIACLWACFWLGSAGAAEEGTDFGSWQAWQERGDILDAKKRVRKLELDIVQLEEQAKRAREGYTKAGNPKQSGLTPRVRAVERGRAGYRAQVRLVDGRLVWLCPGERVGDLQVVAITRERVLVRTQGAVTDLAFE